MSASRHQALLVAAVLFAALATAPGCGSEPASHLEIDDLTDSEMLFVERVIVLERARAVALRDRDTGGALLDSLSLAWGDSSLSETAAALPDDPERSAQVGRLLMNLLAIH